MEVRDSDRVVSYVYHDRMCGAVVLFYTLCYVEACHLMMRVFPLCLRKSEAVCRMQLVMRVCMFQYHRHL